MKHREVRLPISAYDLLNLSFPIGILIRSALLSAMFLVFSLLVVELRVDLLSDHLAGSSSEFFRGFTFLFGFF
jgi:hypothetical protein